VTHQQVSQGFVEVMAARDPAGLVQQPDGRFVIQPGPVGPGQRAQRQGESFGVAGAAGLRHDGLSGRPETVRIGRDIIMCLLCTYHEGIRRL
jgi:hypothetical protein